MPFRSVSRRGGFGVGLAAQGAPKDNYARQHRPTPTRTATGSASTIGIRVRSGLYFTGHRLPSFAWEIRLAVIVSAPTPGRPSALGIPPWCRTLGDEAAKAIAILRQDPVKDVDERGQSKRAKDAAERSG